VKRARVVATMDFGGRLKEHFLRTPRSVRAVTIAYVTQAKNAILANLQGAKILTAKMLHA